MEQSPQSSPAADERKQPAQTEPAPGSPPSSPKADDAQQPTINAKDLQPVVVVVGGMGTIFVAIIFARMLPQLRTVDSLKPDDLISKYR